jgi:hypothetical protein
MSDPITTDHIERLGRAILAALTPITGDRAAGEVVITAGPDELVSIPKNTYLLPVVNGQLRDDLPFKTTEAAAISASASLAVPVTSNIGGVRHNLPDGTVFRFRPKLPGVLDEAVANGAMTGGTDTDALIRAAVVFEDLEEAGPAKDVFAAKVGDSPAVVLAWSASEPVDGSSAGLGTKSTRAGRGKQFWRETYVLYIRAGHLGSDHERRREGQLVAQAVTALLSDRKVNLDGEVLATIGGGVEIIQRAKLGRGPTYYLYGMRLRATQTIERADSRTFERWLTSRVQGAAEELPIVDVTVDMP